MNWMPIAEAPRDGTKVDLWVVHFSQVSREGEGYDRSEWRITDAFWGKPAEGEIGWCECHDPYNDGAEPWLVEDGFSIITHFILIPPGPTTTNIVPTPARRHPTHAPFS